MDPRTDSQVIGTFEHCPDTDLITVAGIKPHTIDDRLARCLFVQVVKPSGDGSSEHAVSGVLQQGSVDVGEGNIMSVEG